MSKRGDLECLTDIREAIARIEQYTAGLNYDSFLKDTKTQDAVVRNLEILGEAVKNLSADFKKTHKNIEWKSIAGTRDRLVHDYFGVNWDIVWNVITEKLRSLTSQLQVLLKEQQDN